MVPKPLSSDSRYEESEEKFHAALKMYYEAFDTNDCVTLSSASKRNGVSISGVIDYMIKYKLPMPGDKEEADAGLKLLKGIEERKRD
jgi:hypothetical protein